MHFFTADEHYGHKNIIKYCNRPFTSTVEMDKILIARHNSVVGKKDTVIHAGDFTLGNTLFAEAIISQLNGKHIFISGGHDKWLGKNSNRLMLIKINKQLIVVCHYAMRVWAGNNYGSWQIYGHSHGKLNPIGLQYDVGVDNNNFYPVSFDQLKEIFSIKKCEWCGKEILAEVDTFLCDGCLSMYKTYREEFEE